MIIKSLTPQFKSKPVECIGNAQLIVSPGTTTRKLTLWLCGLPILSSYVSFNLKGLNQPILPVAACDRWFTLNGLRHRRFESIASPVDLKFCPSLGTLDPSSPELGSVLHLNRGATRRLQKTFFTVSSHSLWSSYEKLSIELFNPDVAGEAPIHAFPSFGIQANKDWYSLFLFFSPSLGVPIASGGDLGKMRFKMADIDDFRRVNRPFTLRFTPRD